MVIKWVEEQNKQVREKVAAWLEKQPAHVEVAVTSAAAGVQGGVLGAFIGYMYAPDPTKPATASPANQPPWMAGSAASKGEAQAVFSGGPLSQGGKFAAMAAANALILNVMKRQKQPEDISQMAASFGSGAAFSLMTPAEGANPAVNALSTGFSFAVVQGIFTKVSTVFAGKKMEKDDPNFASTRDLLLSLGLEKYEKNFRNGDLTDRTLPLLTDSALKDVKIPPGARLLILDSVSSRYGRNTSH